MILKQFPLEPDDVRSTSMGSYGEDIQLSPEARRVLGGIQIECKRRKSFKTIYDFMGQANQNPNFTPVVFIRGDREKPLAIMPADYYLSLLG